MTLGALAGLGAQRWVRRRIERVVRAGRPQGIGAAALRRAGGVAGEVRTALAEGRVAMTEKEAELRALRTPTPDRNGSRPVLRLVETEQTGPSRRWSRPPGRG
jgi:hypothetical protein